MTIQLPLLLKTHNKMYNKSLFNQFLHGIIQVNTNHQRLKITCFIESFGDLIDMIDEDIHTFVCDTNASNSTRSAEFRISIEPGLSTYIKVIRFELKYRELCNVILYEATNNAIYMDKINILPFNRNQEKINTSRRKEQSPQDILVPYIKARNFEEFELAFQWTDRIIVGVTTIRLYCIIGQNYFDHYKADGSRREYIIKYCGVFTGEVQIRDSELIYDLLVQCH